MNLFLLRNVSSTKESVYSEILLQPTNLFTQESFFNQGICLLRNPSTQEYFFNKRICLLRNLSSDKEYIWRLLRNPLSTKESVYVEILLQPRNLFTRAFFLQFLSNCARKCVTLYLCTVNLKLENFVKCTLRNVKTTKPICTYLIVLWQNLCTDKTVHAVHKLSKINHLKKQ